MKKLLFLLLFTGVLFACSKKDDTPARVTAYFSWKVVRSTSSTFTVQFTNKSTEASSYEWSFGDGSMSANKDVEHTFNAGNSYSVTLSAIDATRAETSDSTDDTWHDEVTIVVHN